MSPLTTFLQTIVPDKEMLPTHISLYVALHHCWTSCGAPASFHISRASLMRLSKIHSIATYHKCIKELQNKGHIIYRSSYHPVKGSEVQLVHTGKQ